MADDHISAVFYPYKHARIAFFGTFDISKIQAVIHQLSKISTWTTGKSKGLSINVRSARLLG